MRIKHVKKQLLIAFVLTIAFCGAFADPSKRNQASAFPFRIGTVVLNNTETPVTSEPTEEVADQPAEAQIVSDPVIAVDQAAQAKAKG